MAVTRRRLLQAVALTAGAAESADDLDALRHVSAVHGTNLSDARLQLLKPVLERRRAQLQALRDFPIDDQVAPTQGILDK